MPGGVEGRKLGVFPSSSYPICSHDVLRRVDRRCLFFHDTGMAKTEIRSIASPVLNSSRLILRPFTLSDAPALFSWASDPEVTAYLRFPAHTSVQDSQRIIRHWIESDRHPPFFHWALEVREDFRVIGSIGIEISSLQDNRGEIGYCIAKEAWNQGYATEALSIVLRFAMEQAGFHRIEACHAEGNTASKRVMEKAGMIHEAGPLHHYYRSDILGYQNVHMFALTSDTYRTR